MGGPSATGAGIRGIRRKGPIVKKIYLVKKNPEVNVDENNWITMNSHEFALFIQTEEGQKRRKNFGQMNAVDENDYIIIMECDADTANEMRKEVNREAYIHRTRKESGFSFFSLEEKKNEEDRGIEETELADPEENVEQKALKNIDIEKLWEGLGKLSEEQMDLINNLYLVDEPLSEYQYGEKTGIARTTLRSRKDTILSQLKDSIENSSK